MEKTIGFIGAGRITNIFLQALKNKKFSLKNISVFDTNNEICEKLKTNFPEIQVSDLGAIAAKDIVFIALHPPVIMETMGRIKEAVKNNSIIVSLAPKITIEKIAVTLGNNNVVRMIPNAASIINQGYNPVCFSADCKDKTVINEILSLFGKTFETDESKLEAYAISSAMLPTYFWFQWYEMIEISKKMGLSEIESIETLKESLLASIATMFDSNLTQEQVIDLVPLKPIGEHEQEIKNMLNTKLIGLYGKIKP